MKSTNPVNSQLTAGGPPSPADSDAAARRQTQNDDIASSNPRLVKIAPSGAIVGDAQSLSGPPGTDYREVQGGCQNGQQWRASRRES